MKQRSQRKTMDLALLSDLGNKRMFHTTSLIIETNRTIAAFGTQPWMPWRSDYMPLLAMTSVLKCTHHRNYVSKISKYSGWLGLGISNTYHTCLGSALGLRWMSEFRLILALQCHHMCSYPGNHQWYIMRYFDTTKLFQLRRKHGAAIAREVC